MGTPGIASSMSKRSRSDAAETLKVLLLMNESSPYAPVIHTCSTEHVEQSGNTVSYLFGNDATELKDKVADVDIVVHCIFAGANTKAIGELWPHMPNVRWVHSLSAGVDALCPVLRPCERIESIPVSNAKGAFSSSLAEWCITSFLHFNKQIPRIQQNRTQRKWDKFVMSELKGTTVGFVGFGSIAQETAKLCRAFGMRVIALRRSLEGAGSESADKVYTIADDKMTVFKEADFVVCSLPGTPGTENFCGAKEFGAMKDTGVFVSIGRGTCVDEDALAAALKQKQIAGAACDVFKVEPLPADSALWECENTVLSAHNADNTPSYMLDAWNVYMRNFGDFQAGKPFPTISVEHGY